MEYAGRMIEQYFDRKLYRSGKHFMWSNIILFKQYSQELKIDISYNILNL